MTEEEYFAQRLDSQIKWFSAKSGSNQANYKRLKVAEIAIAASIPFLAGFVTEQTAYMKLAVGAAGVTVAIIAGIMSIYRFQENWIQYRTTCEALRQHRFQYLTRTGPYTGQDPFADLVNNVESLLANENRSWADYIGSKPGEAGTQ